MWFPLTHEQKTLGAHTVNDLVATRRSFPDSQLGKHEKYMNNLREQNVQFPISPSVMNITRKSVMQTPAFIHWENDLEHFIQP